MLTTYFKRPDENLQKFDEVAAKRNISLFAGTDAHSNVGFHLFGDDSGNKGLKIKIDDYTTIFKLARQHVLIEKDKPLTRETLLEALKAGRSFIGFDAIGDTSGFRFEAVRTDQESDANVESVTMGSQMSDNSLSFRVTSPKEARFVIFRNGEKFSECIPERQVTIDIDIPLNSQLCSNHGVGYGQGTYRVEVYLDQLGPPFDKMPWIISNPIYVR
jgi:hypothetical protein